MSTEDEADKEAQRRRALLHGAPQPPARQPQPGQEVWRLRSQVDGAFRVANCAMTRRRALALMFWSSWTENRCSRGDAGLRR